MGKCWPGPYGIPVNEPYFTLSRAITSAGGLGPLAEPDKVDLRRIVGQDREAIIRLDLAGIRNGTEPDVVLRPSDQIIVGTGFWNRPMFVLREGSGPGMASVFAWIGTEMTYSVHATLAGPR